MIQKGIYIEEEKENEIIITSIKKGKKLLKFEELDNYSDRERIVFRFDLFKEKINFDFLPNSLHIEELIIELLEAEEYKEEKKPSEYWEDMFKEDSKDNWEYVWNLRSHMKPSLVNSRSILEKFPKIERLNIVGESFLAIDTLADIQKLKELKILQLKIAHIEDEAKLHPLAKSRKLRELSLLGKFFYLSGFDGLEKLTSLTRLTFDTWTYYEYDERLEEHISKWQKLESLDLTENYEGDLTPLLKCKNLKKLVVGKNIYIRGKKPSKEEIPSGLLPYYDKIEEKSEDYGTLFIIGKNRRFLKRKSKFDKLIEEQKKRRKG